MSFLPRLRAIQEAKQSVLCVGLDPDPSRLPAPVQRLPGLAEAILTFNTAIIEATATQACAFKLNFAFYEALGAEGWDVLGRTLALIPDDAVTIADAKRGDIGNSARFYAEAIYHRMGFDAGTVAPYMGRDAVAPFLQFENKAAFVLGRTSNAGAADFQHLACNGTPLYVHVARKVSTWDTEAPGTAGLVVGATSPDALRTMRETAPTLPFLIPGVGAQGGDAATVMQAAATPDGLVLVNSSRGILYASEGHGYAQAAADAAQALRETLHAAHPAR